MLCCILLFGGNTVSSVIVFLLHGTRVKVQLVLGGIPVHLVYRFTDLCALWTLHLQRTSRLLFVFMSTCALITALASMLFTPQSSSVMEYFAVSLMQ